MKWFLSAGCILSAVAVALILRFSYLSWQTAQSSLPASETEEPTDSKKPKAPLLKDGSFEIGFAGQSGSDFWNLVQAGAKLRARELSIGLIYLAPNLAIDSEVQVTQLSDLMRMDLKALIVAPCETEVVAKANSLQKKNYAGILVAMDTLSPTPEGRCEPNWAVAAALAADWCSAQPKAKAGVLIVSGRPEDSAQRELARLLGLLLSEQGIHVTETLTCDQTETGAQKTLTAYWDAGHDRPGLIVTTDDAIAQGAALCLQLRNRSVPILSFGGTVPALRKVEIGLLSAVIDLHPYNLGQCAVDTAVALLSGDTESTFSPAPPTLVTASNATSVRTALEETLSPF